MGGGSSKSSTSQKTNYETHTTTTTQIHDIGFTGAQAVDMAAVLETGSIARHELTAKTLDNLVQATGNAWNQLIGGAGQLVETSRQIAENSFRPDPVMTYEATKAEEKPGIASQLLPIGAAVVAGAIVIGMMK